MDIVDSEKSGTEHQAVQLSRQRLTDWADSCLRIQHLDDLVQREISAGSLPRAKQLAERARRRAWILFNQMIEAGAEKPSGYREPDHSGGAGGQ